MARSQSSVTKPPRTRRSLRALRKMTQPQPRNPTRGRRSPTAHRLESWRLARKEFQRGAGKTRQASRALSSLFLLALLSLLLLKKEAGYESCNEGHDGESTHGAPGLGRISSRDPFAPR